MRTTLAVTAVIVRCRILTKNIPRLTICKHYDKDDEAKSPLENDAESDQCNEDVSKSRDDVEENQLDAC